MNKKLILRILKYALSLVGIYVLYFGGMIVYGTLTDWQPEEKIPLHIDGNSQLPIVDRDSLTFIDWNIGYGGLGAESNFFYDAGGYFWSIGHMVRPPKNLTEKNQAGIEAFVRDNPADFYLFQEADVASRRSHYINQYEGIRDQLEDYTSDMAINFDVNRVPIPVNEPWDQIGCVKGGLASYSRFQPTDVTRYDFPGQMKWPNRIFYLDRCMSVHRYKTHYEGKELVVINSHNEAYDEKGDVKKAEMEYLKAFIENEYVNKGNFVIVAADWNQCPPEFNYEHFMKDEAGDYKQFGIARDFVAADWTWVYDTKVPTNRKVAEVYEKGKTFVTLIDFYLCSPNVEPVSVEGVDMGFAFSDHQPVKMTVRLNTKRLPPHVPF